MQLIIYKALAAIIIFTISIVSALYPLKTKTSHTESLELGEAFASGIFLGVAFFHMLPHSISIFQQYYPHIIFPIPEAICAGGFLLMLFLERLSLANAFFKPEHSIPYVLAIILIIHSLTEGGALGIGNTFAEALLLFIAIIAHKGSASFALSVTLMRYELPYWRILFLLILFSFMTPLGIGLGIFITSLTGSTAGELTTSFFNAFAAGTFLYISTLHHIRFHQRIEASSHGMIEFLFLTIGLVAMAVIAIWT